jgi:uncharacterized protein
MTLGATALLPLLLMGEPQDAVPVEGTCAGVVEATASQTGCAAEPALVSPVNSTDVRWRDALLTALAVALAGGGILYVRANETWRRARGSGPRKIDPTPYAAGAALGIVIVGSLAAFGRPVGASGAFQNLIAAAGRRLAPANSYWTAIAAGFTWQVWVILGVVAGAFVGAVANGRFRLRAMPEVGWVEAFGPSKIRRWIIAFVAAAVIEFASAIAGGCTSGLALSGGIVLAPAAFLFMAAMFATGIPTAAWVGRRIRRRQEP